MRSKKWFTCNICKYETNEEWLYIRHRHVMDSRCWLEGGLMTRPKIQNICDFCGKEIAIDAQEYTAEFSQKGAGRGKYVKATPKADVCHPCFLEVCKTGFKPVWQTWKKYDESNKWEIEEE